MLLKGVCSSVSIGLFPNSLPTRFLTRSLSLSPLRLSDLLEHDAASYTRNPAETPVLSVNRPLPNLISRAVRLTPVETLFIPLNARDKLGAHSHFIPLSVRLLTVKSVTVFSLPFNNGASVAVTITAIRVRGGGLPKASFIPHGEREFISHYERKKIILH